MAAAGFLDPNPGAGNAGGPPRDLPETSQEPSPGASQGLWPGDLRRLKKFPGAF